MLVQPIDRATPNGQDPRVRPPGQADAAIPCFTLPGGLVVVILDMHSLPAQISPASLRPSRDGKLLPAPTVKVQLPCSDGSQRVLITLHGAAGTTPIDFADAGGQIVVHADPQAAQPLPMQRLTEGLDEVGTFRLIRQVAETWRNLFHLRHDPAYARFCRRLLKELALQPHAVTPEAAVTRHLALVSAVLPANLGDITEIVLVGDDALEQAVYRPLQTKRGRSYLLLDRAAVKPGCLIVVLGTLGQAVLRLEELPSTPILAWLESHRSLSRQLRAFIQRSVVEARADDGSTAALLRELSFFAPAEQRNLLARKSPVTAAIDLLVADGEGGVFLKGWVRDAHQLLAGAHLRFGDNAPIALDPHWLRFPRPDIDKLYKGRSAAFGFAAYIQDAGSQRGQAVVTLELGSGGALDLMVRPAMGSAAELRDAVLGGIPPERLTTDAIARIIAPAAVPLHRRHLASRQAPDVVQLGVKPKRPRFSIIVPLYRNLDYLRFQVGAFALDPEMTRAELIFVLDSPEQRADLVHFLSGLNQLYGLPMTILIMSANFGYAAANNAGAAIAAGEYLVLLNSDVVPEEPGWLSRLAAPLKRGRKVLASGARLLFDDQSLQHAGMRFTRDAGGHWLNLHYHKGAPRDFAPALKARKVPAVTGAALLVRRAAFQQVGGFTEDYIIGDYEDSDLCLKLRALGGEICYCPEAVLYHFERKSINRHAGYQRSVAGLYNRWLAAQRWNDAMQDLMVRFDRARPGAAQ
ncbi:glycosyltransferase family 2 protein [Dongia sp.]|uniref:glycosyltransferase family 2 protein n=1 Tax=Dongia sp. TaxID=1977262 RepID=UPI0035AF4595